MYCGALNVPKGRRRGTAAECAAKRQVRYYGIEKLDPSLLKKLVQLDTVTQIEKEQLKLSKLDFKAKKLLDNIKITKLIMEKNITDKERKKYNTRLNKYLKERDILVPKFNKQRDLVRSLKDQR